MCVKVQEKPEEGGNEVGGVGGNPQGQIPILSLTLVIPRTSMQKVLVLFQQTQRRVLRVTSGTNWAQELSLTLKI